MSSYNPNTWTIAVAYGRIAVLLNAAGEIRSRGFALRSGGVVARHLMSVLSGIMPDALADASRQIARWLFPLDDTPLDVLPYLLRHYGLPPYAESYEATLARLRDAWPTHENAGSVAQLLEQLELCGLVNPAIVELDPDTLDGVFHVEADNIGADLVFGSFDFASDVNWGGQVDPTIAANVRAALRYFCPARSKLDDFRTTTT